MKKKEIHPTVIWGQAMRPLQGMVDSKQNPINTTITVDGELYVGPYSIIGEGVHLGNNVIIDSHIIIERGVEIRENTLVVHRATIGGYSKIGKDCVIGGLIGEGTIIGNNCRVFGTIVHKQENPTLSWDHREFPEPSVVIHHNSFVGFETFVAGNIEIGPASYVCAGAIITKTVPPEYIAYGENQLIHYTKWKGPLSKSNFFEEGVLNDNICFNSKWTT